MTQPAAPTPPPAAVPAAALARPEVQRAFVRGAAYELLSLAFLYPEAAAEERQIALAADLVAHPLAAEGELGPAVARYRDALTALSWEALGPCHLALFAGEVLCSPHETEYLRDPFARPPGLADIAGFYHAFGLRLGEEHPTAPDHIATELEFMSLLARKQAYAALRAHDDPADWAERAAITHDATRAFLAEHLGRWVEPFTTELAERAPVLRSVRPTSGEQAAEVFRAAAALLRRLVTADLAREGLAPRPLGRRRALPEDAEAMTCPMSDPEVGGDGPDPFAAGPAAAPR